MTIDLCTYNVGNAKPNAVTQDLRRLMARFPVVGLQEAADRKAEMNATGAQVLTGTKRDEGHVALLVAAGTPIVSTGYVSCTRRTFVGQWGAGPGEIAAKGIRWARVVVDGIEVTVGVTHKVPSVQRPAKGPIARVGRARRRALYRKHIRADVAWVKSVTGPVVLVMDANATSDFDLLQPLRDAGLTCSSAPSMGKRDIDQLWSRGLTPMVTEALAHFSSDHKPVTTTYEHQGAPVPTPIPDRWEHVEYAGVTVDRDMEARLLIAERRLGYELTATQGINPGGWGPSGGTHDGPAIDLAPWDWKRKVRVLRDLGFAAWHRVAIKGLWPEHIHAVPIGNKNLSPEATAQVVKYFNGEDGLKGNNPDPDPYRPDPPVAFDYVAAWRDNQIRERNTSLRARIRTLRDRISANRNRITYK